MKFMDSPEIDGSRSKVLLSKARIASHCAIIFKKIHKLYSASILMFHHAGDDRLDYSAISAASPDVSAHALANFFRRQIKGATPVEISAGETELTFLPFI